MKQLTLFIATIACIISCSKSDNSSDKNKYLFENIHGTDTLKIKAKYSDCGEWGGHFECIDIYRSDNNKLTLHYQRDTVNCPDPSLFNRRIIDEWKKELSAEDQDHIMNFINDLTKRTFIDEGISNAGDYYVIKRSTGSLTIEYSNYNRDWTGLKELKKKITTANKTYKQ